MDPDPLGAPIGWWGIGVFLFSPDQTSKAAQGTAVIASFITRSFTLICEGTPDAPPLSDSHK